MYGVSEKKTPRPIKPLAPEVARKIAAGEVIDRPNAVVRELMDNAVDSGASSITVEIEGGGIDLIRVADNGAGMTKEDLQECAHPHATSKISSETDLLNLSTLGFRGEALASISSVSRLEIQSRRKTEPNGWKLQTYLTEKHVITPSTIDSGTIVQSTSLFENFPARRKFLKQPSSEGTMCRQTFIEKAVPCPDIAFRFIADGKIKIDLPAVQSLSERFASSLEMTAAQNLFSEITASSGNTAADNCSDWHFTLVLSDPSIFRTDKKNIHIYVNGRKIQEYSLVQAIEYGAEGVFPNGTHPAAALFLNINPSLVDFNIHPAKKEARFKDISPIHKAVCASVKNFYKKNMSYSAQNETEPSSFFQDSFQSYSASSRHDADSALHVSHTQSATESELPVSYAQSEKNRPMPFSHRQSTGYAYDKPHTSTLQTAGSNNTAVTSYPAAVPEFSYIGQFFGVFLAAEKNGKIFFIDQHAAHERILFDKFMESAGQKQMLLIPLEIRTETEEESAYIASIKEELAEAGFDMERQQDGCWHITSIPVKWTGSAQDIEQDLLAVKKEPGSIIRSIAASSSCRAAVKDGDYIDQNTAYKLVAQTFALQDPHCPHGRPVWTVITREELYSRVRRS